MLQTNIGKLSDVQPHQTCKRLRITEWHLNNIGGKNIMKVGLILALYRSAPSFPAVSNIAAQCTPQQTPVRVYISPALPAEDEVEYQTLAILQRGQTF